MTGEQQLVDVIRRVKPITDRLVDKVDACPHEAAILGYLLGLRRGYIEYGGPAVIDTRKAADLCIVIERFITEVTEHGLPG